MNIAEGHISVMERDFVQFADQIILCELRAGVQAKVRKPRRRGREDVLTGEKHTGPVNVDFEIRKKSPLRKSPCLQGTGQGIEKSMQLRGYTWKATPATQEDNVRSKDS